jgi:hypothetical protein
MCSPLVSAGIQRSLMRSPARDPLRVSKWRLHPFASKE